MGITWVSVVTRWFAIIRLIQHRQSRLLVQTLALEGSEVLWKRSLARTSKGFRGICLVYACSSLHSVQNGQLIWYDINEWKTNQERMIVLFDLYSQGASYCRRLIQLGSPLHPSPAINFLIWSSIPIRDLFPFIASHLHHQPWIQKLEVYKGPGA